MEGRNSDDKTNDKQICCCCGHYFNSHFQLFLHLQQIRQKHCFVVCVLGCSLLLLLQLAKIASISNTTYNRNDNNTHLPSDASLFTQAVMLSKEKPEMSVFFNTFSTKNNTKLAKDIILSQLQTINKVPLLDGVPLFYARIGDLSWDWPSLECQGGNRSANRPARMCTQIAAVSKGDEMITLSSLHSYCQAPENQGHKVVYIHSKGTFTVNNKNNVLRYALMLGVLSKECVEGVSNKDMDENKCDACSSQFNHLPFFHYVGNMWLAACSYVSKLIPPNQFEARKQAVIKMMLNRTRKSPGHRGWLETRLDNETRYIFKRKREYWLHRKSWMGTERYAAEHWLGSHPDFRPCEVFSLSSDNPPIRYDKWIELNKLRTPKLVRVHESVTSNVSKSFLAKQCPSHPWFARLGRYFEYKQLYNIVPQNGSMIDNFWSGCDETKRRKAEKKKRRIRERQHASPAGVGNVSSAA